MYGLMYVSSLAGVRHSVDGASTEIVPFRLTGYIDQCGDIDLFNRSIIPSYIRYPFSLWFPWYPWLL